MQYEIFLDNDQFKMSLLDQLYEPYVSKQSFYSAMEEDLIYGMGFDYSTYVILIKKPKQSKYPVYVNDNGIVEISKRELEWYKGYLYYYIFN